MQQDNWPESLACCTWHGYLESSQFQLANNAPNQCATKFGAPTKGKDSQQSAKQHHQLIDLSVFFIHGTAHALA